VKSHYLCDALGVVAVIGLTVALSLQPAADQNFLLYAGLAAVGTYAYMTFDVLPKRRQQQLLAQPALAYREVLPPPVPSGMEKRNGHPVADQRVRTTLLPAAL
jgi:hypothetical protein